MSNVKWVVAAVLVCSSSLGFADVVVSDAVEKGEHCVSLSRVRNTEVIDDQTILFHMDGKRTLVNNLPRKCSGLRTHKAFSYKTSIGKLCNTDIIRVYEGDYFGAACGLGMFMPYEKPKKDTSG